MTQTVINYARVLYELQIPDEIIMEAETYFRNVPELSWRQKRIFGMYRNLKMH